MNQLTATEVFIKICITMFIICLAIYVAGHVMKGVH